jgi:prepilin-type N-terminal cleavage/methylation domain-containing protein
MVLFWKGKEMNSRKGFTLVELLIVVLILGALAAIAVPRIMGGAKTAKINACKTNVDMLNSQIELYYANEDAWPGALTDVTDDPNYFPDTDAPACPFETPYSYSAVTHRVSGHVH